jgi:hypothetical protein
MKKLQAMHGQEVELNVIYDIGCVLYRHLVSSFYSTLSPYSANIINLQCDGDMLGSFPFLLIWNDMRIR